jgi:hypothetical protein
MNKIFSMSVFGNNPRYIMGAKRQVDLAKKFYPDFKIKIYVDDVNNFLDFDNDVDIIKVHSELDGTFWRFFPLFENEDNIVLVRDADGRVTYREKMAVEEWLESNKSFHTIRDHQSHYEYPIIACAFGYKGRLPDNVFKAMDLYKNQSYYTVDQVYLRDCVWPFVENDSFIHSMNDEDSWFSESRKNLKNKYAFLNAWDENDMPFYPDSLNNYSQFEIDKFNEIYKFDEGVFMKNNSYYIITIHNKEDLIEKVLNGIVDSHSYDFNVPIIVCVVDGCTDNTENIILNFKKNSVHPESIHLVYENDVHEVLSLNSGLNFIKNNLSPNAEDLIFCIQDDVVLDEKDINLKFNKLFSTYPNLGYISMRIGIRGLASNGQNDIYEGQLMENECGAWNQINQTGHENILNGTFVPCEIAVRSPTCVLWARYEELGFFDENLAPAGYDCHDMSVRMNIAGYQNGLYALNFISDINWGTMRSLNETTRNLHQIYSKNRAYLAQKHQKYFLGMQ